MVVAESWLGATLLVIFKATMIYTEIFNGECQGGGLVPEADHINLSTKAGVAFIPYKQEQNLIANFRAR